MKKSIRILLSISILLTAIINSYAFDKDYQSIVSSSDLGMFVTNSKNDKKEVKLISKNNLDLVRTSLKRIKGTDNEVNRAILKLMSLTDNQLDEMGQNEINRMLDGATELVVATEYIKVDQYGVSTSMDANECLEEIARLEEAQLVRGVLPPIDDGGDPRDGYNMRISGDGYMMIVTMMTYEGTNPTKGWYKVRASYSWLKLPAQRLTDGISLFNNNVIWSTTPSDYKSTMSYKTTNSSGSPVTYTFDAKNVIDNLQNGGVFAEYRLPSAGSISNLNFELSARVKVYTTNTQMWSRYVHLTAAISPKFSISLASGGLSLSGGLSFNGQEYNSSCSVVYTP